MKQKNEEKKNIVILGGGFAGVRAVLDLAEYFRNSEEYEIILVDKKDYHVYHAALYEAATAQHGVVEARKVKNSVAISFSDIFSKVPVKVFKGYIERIELEDGKIVTDSRVISFDYLIVSMGSVADFYGIPGLDKYGFTLKSVEDAIMIRNRVEDIVSKNDSAQIIIGGGGFAGVEFAGELHNLLRHECEHHQKDFSKFKLLVVEGGITYLSGLADKVSQLVLERLNKMGIENRFSTLITEAGKDYVVLNNKEKINCELLVWTGGVKSCRLPASVDIERDKKDRTSSTEFLNLKKFPNVFLAGDNVCIIDPVTKKPAPQTAQEAIRQGEYAAKNVYRMIEGKNLLPYAAGSTRFIIPVTGKYAIVYTKNIIISGLLGWVIRRFVDLKYFVSVLPWFMAFSLWLSETKTFTKND